MQLKGSSSFNSPMVKGQMQPGKEAVIQRQKQAPGGKQGASQADGFARSPAMEKHSTPAAAGKNFASQQTMSPKDTGLSMKGKMQSLSRMSRTMSEAQLPSNPSSSTTVMKHLTEIALPLLGDGLSEFVQEDSKKTSKSNGTSRGTEAHSEGKEGGKTAGARGQRGRGKVQGRKHSSHLDRARKLIKREFAGDESLLGGKGSLKEEVGRFGKLRSNVLSNTGGASQAQLRNAIQNAATAIWDILKKTRDEDESEDMTSGLLGLLLKIHSAYTSDHSNRVMDLTMGLAEELGIDDQKELEDLRNAAFFKDIGQRGPDDLSYVPCRHEGDVSEYIKTIKKGLRECSNLHDIGKMRIPESIINKPARLNNEEFAIIKKHPVIGVEIVRPFPALYDAIPGIRGHHEKWDGSGYPDRLAGNKIPLQARIISICDTFDAMTEDRPYRKALSTDEAVRELLRCSGTQFDPHLVPPFIYALAKKGEIDINIYQKEIEKLEEKFGFKSKKSEELRFNIKNK